MTYRCEKCSKLSLRACRQSGCVQQAEIQNHCYISRTHKDQGQRKRRRVVSSDEVCKSDNNSQCGLADHENESDNESVADNFALLDNEMSWLVSLSLVYLSLRQILKPQWLGGFLFLM